MKKRDIIRIAEIEARLGRKFNKAQRKAIIAHEKMHDALAWKYRLHQMTLEEVHAMLAKTADNNPGYSDLHENAGDTNAPTPVSAWITTLKEVSHVPLIAGFIALLEEKYQPTDGLHADEFERLADEWKVAYADIGNVHFEDEHPGTAPKSEWMREVAKQLDVPFVDLPMAKLPLTHNVFMPDFTPDASEAPEAPAPGLGKQMQKRMAKPVSPRVKRYKRKSLARKDDGPTAAN